MKAKNKAILTALEVIGIVALIVSVISIITTILSSLIGEWIGPALFAVYLVGLGIITYKSAKKDFENDKTEEQ